MSRKLEEMRSDLNSHILNAIDSAIEEKVIPSVRNALGSQNWAENTSLDFRSDDRIRVLLVKYVRKGTFGQMDRTNKMLVNRS